MLAEFKKPCTFKHSSMKFTYQYLGWSPEQHDMYPLKVSGQAIIVNFNPIKVGKVNCFLLKTFVGVSSGELQHIRNQISHAVNKKTRTMLPTREVNIFVCRCCCRYCCY